MAYDFAGNNGAYVNFGSSFVSKDDPRPITISLRHRASNTSNNAGGNQSWFFTNNAGSNSPQLGAALRSGDPARIRLYADGIYVDSNTFSADTSGFHCYMWVWDSDNSYEMFRDGVSIGSGTRALSGTNADDDAAISYLSGSTRAFAVYGDIAEFALWDRALDVGDAAAVHAGTPLVAPNGLIAYLPFIRDNNTDVVNGDWTYNTEVSGTPAVTPHPSVKRSHQNILGFPPVAAGGGGTIPVFWHHYNTMRRS